MTKSYLPLEKRLTQPVSGRIVILIMRRVIGPTRWCGGDDGGGSCGGNGDSVAVVAVVGVGVGVVSCCDADGGVGCSRGGSGSAGGGGGVEKPTQVVAVAVPRCA